MSVVDVLPGVRAAVTESRTAIDRVLYALFADRADRDRHERDRHRYRGADLRTDFDVYLARVYGVSWLAALLAFAPTVLALAALAEPALATAGAFLTSIMPLAQTRLPVVPRPVVAVAAAVVAAAVGKRSVVSLGGQYLRWRSSARRANIERTLPGAVRYLHVLASGSDGQRTMLRRVADTDAYGDTAVAFRAALNTASLTGSVDEGLRRVARDTPSRDLLSPFLMKFREHAAQGPDALANYLRMESRMLGHRQARERDRAAGFLELLAELFMVLLVLPSLLVIVLTVTSVIAPGLGDPVVTPLGATTVRGLLVYGSAAFIAVVGAGTSLLVGTLRPPDQRVTYGRPTGVADAVRSAGRNPESALRVFLGPAALAAAALAYAGVRVVVAVLLAYALYTVPVGVAAVRRARRDDAKDRELKDFVHAVSGHVSLGRPFPEAVERVARDVDLGPLNEDVADLALNLSITSRDAGRDALDVRSAALARFVTRVGTPLAEQTIGLVTGALNAGSDTETIFDTLQSEIARLYHEKRALRSSMLVYVAVGWTTALLVVGITVAVNVSVLDSFAQLSSVAGDSSVVLHAESVDIERDRFRMYVVTQATMLAAGWFAGTASRSRYEALLHSGLLVVLCHVVYAGAGLL